MDSVNAEVFSGCYIYGCFFEFQKKNKQVLQLANYVILQKKLENKFEKKKLIIFLENSFVLKYFL